MEDEPSFPRMIQPSDCINGAGGCLYPDLVAEAMLRESLSLSFSIIRLLAKGIVR